MTAPLHRLPVREADLFQVAGFSRPQAAIWTTWPTLGLQVDAGEGAATLLGDAASQCSVLAITHGHGDHVLGLLGMIIARLGHTTRRGGPLAIYYPRGCREVAMLRRAAEVLWEHHGAKDWERITWEAISPGDRRRLSGKRELVAFQTQHYARKDILSLGYAVVRAGRQIRPEFAGLVGANIEEAVRAQGRNAIFEDKNEVLLAQTGDTMPLDEPLIRDARVRLLDATFLRPEDRGVDMPTHAAVTEWVELLGGTPGHVIFHHLSLRYERAGLAAQIAKLVGNAFPGGVSWFDHGNWELLVEPSEVIRGRSGIEVL